MIVEVIGYYQVIYKHFTNKEWVTTMSNSLQLGHPGNNIVIFFR